MDTRGGASSSAGAPSAHVPSVFAVMPTHNQVEQTLRCLRSLQAGSVVPTTVVVDDGSSDGTAALVNREFPEVVVLRGDGNLWWTGATNLGTTYALDHGAEFVLTLNADGVADPLAVAVLVSFARSDGPVLAGSLRRGLNVPDKAYCGLRFEPTRREWYRHVPPPVNDQPVRVDAMGCNSLLIPRQCFQDVGLFDAEAFPQGWADLDFQLRAQAAGWTIYCVPESVVWIDLTTRSLGIDSETGLRQAGVLLTSRRSQYHLGHVTRFVYRHAPHRLFVPVLFDRYRPLLVTVARFHGRALRRATSRMLSAVRRCRPRTR